MQVGRFNVRPGECWTACQTHCRQAAAPALFVAYPEATVSTITRPRAQRLHDGVHLWSYVVLLPVQELHIEHAAWAERLTLPLSITRLACAAAAAAA